ncbi:hypothetical protein RintRC_2943 [Richelia intracellularis]|nr:hypothetical protein RintRC_2943 [Richelia intracellularis]
MEALSRGQIAVGFFNHYYSDKMRKKDAKIPLAHHFTNNDVSSLVNVAGSGNCNYWLL